MITTVTINPAIDKTVIIDNFNIDKVNRVKETRVDAGGKGINVSKVLHSLNVDTLSMGIVGGTIGSTLCVMLDDINIKHDFIKVSENTRTNIKVVDLINSTCTDINENGPDVSDDKLNELIDKIAKSSEKSEFTVLSGGVQSSVRKTIYKEIIEKLSATNTKVILDTNGDLLKEGIKAKPYLIKPNVSELSEILDKRLESIEEIIEESRKIISNGVVWVAVSMGEEGLLLVSENEALKSIPPKVTARSTVGAGDSVVAAIAAGFYYSKTPEEILLHATAVGSASVTLTGTEVPSNELIEELKKEIKILKY